MICVKNKAHTKLGKIFSVKMIGLDNTNSITVF
jgi:hypothetical protein